MLTMNVEMPELYNISHAADYLKVSRPTLYYMIAKGMFSVIEIDGGKYIPKTALDKYLSNKAAP